MVRFGSTIEEKDEGRRANRAKRQKPVEAYISIYAKILTKCERTRQKCRISEALLPFDEVIDIGERCRPIPRNHCFLSPKIKRLLRWEALHKKFHSFFLRGRGEGPGEGL